MRVKRFTGDTIGDTMSRIKRELGPDAVILQTRRIKEGGFLGLFARTKVEITAAIEEEPVRTAIESREPAVKPINSEYIKRAYEEYRKKENEDVKENKSDNDLTEDTKSEIKQMHNILKEIKGQIAKFEKKQQSFPAPMEKWFDLLRQRGLSQEMANELITAVSKELREELWTDSALVYARLQNQVMKLCSQTDTIKPSDKTLVVALVGPTGVGKTTTSVNWQPDSALLKKRKSP